MPEIATKMLKPFKVWLPMWVCEHCGKWHRSKDVKPNKAGETRLCATCFECWQETRQ